MPVPVTATTLLPLNLLACHSQERPSSSTRVVMRHMFSSLVFMSFLLKRLLLITCRVEGEEAHDFKLSSYLGPPSWLTPTPRYRSTFLIFLIVFILFARR